MFMFLLFLQYLSMHRKCNLSHFHLSQIIALADGSFIVVTYNPCYLHPVVDGHGRFAQWVSNDEISAQNTRKYHPDTFPHNNRWMNHPSSDFVDTISIDTKGIEG